ncbi:hypothetical protein Bca52824_047492 [Brassica carinata]|uniref:Uncharacterized protein n=1 Tax=Brassica carinata TaxID=52824 RepID=A0A8X7RES4_BRACI|nr:hypothetical protein Bca52824_047492 [Brassica carinata]
MDFYVVLERPGYRVARRRRCKARVGIQHRVTKDDAMKWFQVKYEGVILNKSQNITDIAYRQRLPSKQVFHSSTIRINFLTSSGYFGKIKDKIHLNWIRVRFNSLTGFSDFA